MGIFGWLSDRFGEADRKLSGTPQGAPAAPAGPSSEDVLETLARRSDALSVPTVERLGLLFDAKEWKWELDKDGDIASGWDGSMFYFRMVGKQKEILNVLAFRRGRIEREQRNDLLLAIEDWHRTHLWPKGYFRDSEGDTLEVCAEVNVDFEQGATDEQLLLQCRCAIGTILQFFEDIDQRFGVPEESSES